MLFRLPPELRVKIYEILLMGPSGVLRPYGPPAGQGLAEGATNILQVCQAIYHEALPVMYGKNVLKFRRVTLSLPFPKEHILLARRVFLDVRACARDKTGSTAILLDDLTNPAMHLDELSLDLSPRSFHYLWDDKTQHTISYFQDASPSATGRETLLAVMIRLTSLKARHIRLIDKRIDKHDAAHMFKAMILEKGIAEDSQVTVEERWEY